MRSPFLPLALFTVVILEVGVSADAPAQTIGLWGGWNDYGQGWQGSQPAARASPPRYGLFSDGSDKAFPSLMDGGPRPVIRPEPPDLVRFPNSEEPRTALIDNASRRLYFIIDKEIHNRQRDSLRISYLCGAGWFYLDRNGDGRPHLRMAGLVSARGNAGTRPAASCQNDRWA